MSGDLELNRKCFHALHISYCFTVSQTLFKTIQYTVIKTPKGSFKVADKELVYIT